MKFYVVEDTYIAHLKKVDSNVPDNYGGGKAFIGIVLEINGFKYLAPLTSYKPKQDKIRTDMPTCVKLHERRNPDNKLGMVQLNNMIPVSDQVIAALDIANQDRGYQRMLYKQLEYIKTVTADITDKAGKLYKLVCVDKHATFVRLSCDFQALEQAHATYQAPAPAAAPATATPAIPPAEPPKAAGN